MSHNSRSVSLTLQCKDIVDNMHMACHIMNATTLNLTSAFHIANY